MSPDVERTLGEFRAAIASLPLSSSLDRELLEAEPFILGRDGSLSVVYAPFDYVNRGARVALVGVTPGWTQMHASFVQARAGIKEGQDTESILGRVKRVAAFSGSLRTNLVSMLDGIRLAEAVGVESTAELFTEASESILHSTSAVRYPVFKAGHNYTGSAPAISKAPLLAPYLDLLARELAQVDNAIVVPLGKAVEAALEYLVNRDELDEDRCLFGFPHPSGANAHRSAQYEANRAGLTTKVTSWFTPR